MKILLVQNSLYYPAFGGGNKSNRLLLEALAAKGHTCRVLTRVSETFDAGKQAQFLSDLEQRGIQAETSFGVVTYQLNGVDVHTETHISRMREYLYKQVEEFRPTWVLVSSDDPAQLFLKPALDASGGRVVYLSRTTLALPFGPDCAFESRQKTELLRQTAGIVTVSDYVRRYIVRWGPMPAVHLPISLQGKGPFPDLSNFDSGAIAMVNPCAIKGLPIFVELARRMPELPFVAVPTWGTTTEDLELMQGIPNIRVIAPEDDIDKVLAQTRVLLVPSLWAEARSRIVVEAMLRGVPVLGADVGGIPEAMMGVKYLLPVRPIPRYESKVDSQMVPVADVPEQDIAPWYAALREVTGDRTLYEQLSSQSRARAHEYVASIGITPFEEYLKQLTVRSAPISPEDGAGKAASVLPAEKRALLVRLLQQKRAMPVKAAIARADRRGLLPMSYEQERYYRLHNDDPAHVAGNVVVARRVRGALDVAGLRAALNRVIQRHEILRTRFSVGTQEVLETCEADVQIMQSTEAEISGMARGEAQTPFDLSAPPLLRCRILRLGEDDAVLLLIVHHIVADGWSFGIFSRELQECLTGELPVQYADYAAWQRAQDFSAELAWWEEQLKDAPLRTAGAQCFQGSRTATVIANPVSRALKEIARKNERTLFQICLGAVYDCLVLREGMSDIVVATPFANRLMSQTENLIGLFAHPVLIRMRNVADAPKAAAEALAHANVPYDLVIRKCGAVRESLLFNVQTAVNDLPGQPLEIDPGTAENDLRLSVTETDGGLKCMLQHRQGVDPGGFLESFVERLTFFAAAER